MRSRQNPTLKLPRIKIGITIGDPSGIGPAITAKAINELKGLADFLVIGDKWVFDKAPNCQFIDLKNVSHKNFTFGKVSSDYGRSSIEYLDKAIELIDKKVIDCLVTCPISKEAVNLAGFHYAGHTEYLAEKTGTSDFAMMLLNKRLRITLVTRHIRLASVPAQISKDKIYKNILITHRGLKKLFLIKEPRIAVCGLNPHASDNGLIGDQENTVISPAVQEIRNKLKARIDGPMSADVAMHKAMRRDYDCVIAMYHDQALIPLKLLNPDTGVNITLGLAFVRTSPLHGTAFDIAGDPAKADPGSLIEAIRLAVKCTSNLKRA